MSSPFDRSEALPATAAKAVLDQYGMDEVVIIARRSGSDEFHYATWGTTEFHSGSAAMAGKQLASIIAEAAPDRETAVEIGQRVKSNWRGEA